jgi:outer membrane protein TolC
LVHLFPTRELNSRVSLLAAAGMLMAGCTVVPVPLQDTERAQLASSSRERLFEGQEAISAPLNLYQATARALRYQAEYRVRLMEEAAALGQLDVARFDMLPRLAVNAGYSTRSNDAFGFGFNPGGTIATNPSASQERSHNTASIGFAWNVLDFGVSYYRARQLADQSLIAEERRRKAMQNLVQDVRLAFWRAEAAQRLLPVIDSFYDEIDETIEKTRVIESRKLLPPLQTASLRRALLDLAQQISLRRQELTQARIELASLVNAPPGSDVRVAAGGQPSAIKLDLRTSADALEAIALRNRPELAEEAYRSRVSESEARKAMLGLIPNLSLTVDQNYDSNRFLVNNTWASAGLGIAFNLVKAFSLPAINRSADAQRQLDEARRLAMAMAIMTQTRVAAVRYGLLMHEFEVWEEATRDDEQIVKFLSSSAEVGIDTELELIRAKARHLVSRINRDLMYANLEAALGRVFNSTGLDALPDRVAHHDTAYLAEQIQGRIEEWKKDNFAYRAPGEELPIAIAEIQGVPAEAEAEFRKSMAAILESSKLTVTDEARARLRVLAGIRLQPLRDGGRPATVRITVTDIRTGAVRFSSELRTTLSEPVDEDQWRTLGEGEAYRVVGPVLRLQAGRSLPSRTSAAPEPVLQLKTTALIEPQQRAAEGQPLAVHSVEREALVLKFDPRISLPAFQDASHAD